MKLLITCDFDDGAQTLIFPDAGEGDLRKLQEAMAGNPDLVLGVPCQVTPDGPVRNRLIRAGLIRSVEVA